MRVPAHALVRIVLGLLVATISSAETTPVTFTVDSGATSVDVLIEVFDVPVFDGALLIDLPSPKMCLGGVDHGNECTIAAPPGQATCTAPGICTLGRCTQSLTTPCTTDLDCTGVGVCSISVCVGGTNQTDICSEAADCPGGACTPRLGTMSASGTVEIEISGMTTKGGIPSIQATSADLSFDDMGFNLLNSFVLGTLDVTTTSLGGTLNGPPVPAPGVPSGPNFDFDLAGTTLTVDTGIIDIDAGGELASQINDSTRDMSVDTLSNVLETGISSTLSYVDQGGGLFDFTLTIPLNSVSEMEEISCPNGDPPTCSGGFENALSLTGSIVMAASAVLPPPPSSVPVLTPAGWAMLGGFLLLAGSWGLSRRAHAAFGAAQRRQSKA